MHRGLAPPSSTHRRDGSKQLLHAENLQPRQHDNIASCGGFGWDLVTAHGTCVEFHTEHLCVAHTGVGADVLDTNG